jgi:hypothetical protein
MKENGVSRALAEALHRNTTLHELKLSSNRIRDGGARAGPGSKRGRGV